MRSTLLAAAAFAAAVPSGAGAIQQPALMTDAERAVYREFQTCLNAGVRALPADAPLGEASRQVVDGCSALRQRLTGMIVARLGLDSDYDEIFPGAGIWSSHVRQTIQRQRAAPAPAPSSQPGAPR